MTRALFMSGLAVATIVIAVGSVASPLPSAKADYILHCAGCHGTSGDVSPARVPRLHGTAGALLCTEDGRRYAIRLPNVAFARNLSDHRLAALMNFVMFDLGGAAAPRHARPYTPAEVHLLRAMPLTSGNLKIERARIWGGIASSCRVSNAVE